MHVDRHHCGALLDGKPHQRPMHRDRGLDLRRLVGYGVNVVECGGGMSFVAAQPVQACVDNNAMEPAADGGVVSKGAGTAVRRGHRVLQGVLSVLDATAGQPGDSVQLAVVTVEQLLEGVPVACDVGGQQFGVAPLFMKLLSNLVPEAHGRTVTNRWIAGTSPDRPMCQDAAWTVTSPMSVRLSPLVVPNVEIHTSRYDVGADALTGMLLWPGCIATG